MKEISINASKQYSIYILEEEKQFNILSKLISGEKVLVVLDQNIAKFYPAFFEEFLKNKKVFYYIVNRGEKSKSKETCFNILNYLANNEFTKNDTVIAFGGGVVGDLVGFIASVYMRGISYINIPTSLLSMVDSSIGSKTAINLEKGKNLCGTFYSPKAVLIYPKFLDTLSEREIKCGMGEIIKYTYLDKNIVFNGKVDNDLIISCIEYKKSIVEQDEFDSGIRKVLNFGHTFGHAIERNSHFKISHGESVFRGIYYSLILSKAIYNLSEKYLEDYKNYCEYFCVKYPVKFNIKKLLKNIKYDKKRIDGEIDFVLLDKNGKPKIKKISLEEIKEIVKWI